jgi:hypothetical protein
MASINNNYDPVSFKYITGWGGGDTAPASAQLAGEFATIDDIKKLLRKQSKPIKEQLLTKWKNLYCFYADALLEDDSRESALKDGYLKKLQRDFEL